MSEGDGFPQQNKELAVQTQNSLAQSSSLRWMPLFAVICR
jgi:hypothetical protein